MNITLYTYVIDCQNQNLAQTKPLKIVAHTKNTFKDIKETIFDKIGFPVNNQLLMFNGACQPDQGTLEQAACHEAERCNDGKEMFLYLLTDNECRTKPQVANSIGEFILERKVKCKDCLSKVINVPEPRFNKTLARPDAGRKQEEDMEKWVCQQCTFSNDSTNLNCIICEHAR